ncbi:DUF4145 domain-containing protein [Fictibacillus sp. KU28468]|uniref:DUF4145 domain-containing protein n=1 Tax=Fictibacillus sp. KU28468 TaxID=2991053 RepID=UPI00223DF282|nr:DUF4145 domain-containing protein [Fictibacillus sp. KU28468]UZJ78759.1 DUF4145 domain-containing protein [Fictibacillus sp. KU28468]
MKEEKVILLCPYCGNTAPMKLLNNYQKDTYVPITFDEEAQFVDIFQVFGCPVCDGYQLVYTHWNSEEGFYEDTNLYENGEILFPSFEVVNLYKLPKIIKDAYESALKVRNIDNAICAIALRRTLERVCKDNGVVNGKLHQKLNQLQQKGILPPLMGDLFKVIKDFGNMAAHGDDVIFDKSLIDGMFRFTNKILEYVYILPQEMNQARIELELLAGEEGPINEKEDKPKRKSISQTDEYKERDPS